MELPRCRNNIKGYGCEKSAMRLVEENDEGWAFVCDTCKLVQVISKEGVRDKSKFDAAAKRREQQAVRLRRLDARPKIFT